MNYAQAIKLNYEHMQSNASEWSALEVVDVVEVETDSGSRSMPTFNFPTGYKAAPSLFKNESGGDLCCELCGHSIKNVYWIVNDSRQWIMGVGSECVTHFSEKSGVELTKEAKQARSRAFIREVNVFARKFYEATSYRSHVGYGRYERRFRYVSASPLWTRMKKLIKNTAFVDSSMTDAAVTRWINKNEATARELIEEMRSFAQRVEIKLED